MRLAFALLLLLPSFASAQTKEMIEAVQRKLDSDRTAKWVFSLQDPMGGFYLAPQDPNLDQMPRPSLRATNAAVRTLKYRGFTLLKGEQEKHAAFVLKCYDPKTGGFADTPGGKPDVATTSIGVMVAAELNIPHEKFAKAMDYLKENAKTFEDVRIGAAAVEAWGVKDCPFKLDEWIKTAVKHADSLDGTKKVDDAREVGSVTALLLRLQAPLPEYFKDVPAVLTSAQNERDGGWGTQDPKLFSNIETTYRVMRALMLLKEKPKHPAKLREYLESHRNDDGGYAVKPGEKSDVSGAYYATIITKWLDDMEKK